MRLVLQAFFSLAFATNVFAQAESYPNRPVRVIVPFAAGGPTDAYARLMAEKLQAALGQPFIVENKAGATGTVGGLAVATAAPDGYTLLFASNSSHVISPLLQNKRPFESKDFRPLSMLLYYPLYLVVNNDVPAKTVAEFVAHGKQPGKGLNFGSPGTGSGGHLVGEMFKGAASINAVHVPYRGVGPAQVDLMAGQIQFIFDSVLGSQQLVDAGKIRGIAVTGSQRLPRVPNIPTLKESGYDGFEDVVIWLGMLAPAGLPEPIAAKLESELAKAARLPDIAKRVADSSSIIVGGSGAEFATFIERETPTWETIIKKNNISAGN
ncbi:MAG: tripartite tricarboxylate transporter substrate binding protein [Pseudolabrys sp.]|nr:tripartite tricarboxylate transporter substrate binding protein [Pseudolabrys sp.]